MEEFRDENTLEEELAEYAIYGAYYAGEMAILNNMNQSS